MLRKKQKNNQTRSQTTFVFFLRRREYPVTQGSRVCQSSEKKNQTGQIHTLPPIGRIVRVSKQDKKEQAAFPVSIFTLLRRNNSPKEIDSDQLPIVSR
jgi:hypothetical protein